MPGLDSDDPHQEDNKISVRDIFLELPFRTIASFNRYRESSISTSLAGPPLLRNLNFTACFVLIQQPSKPLLTLKLDVSWPVLISSARTEITIREPRWDFECRAIHVGWENCRP